MKSRQVGIRRKPKQRAKKQPAPKRASSSSSRPAALPEQRPRIGLEATVERVVELQHTIRAVSPELPAVFSTPMMIALMEHATVKAITPELPPGAISVGTRIEVDHLKAVGTGANVVAWAKFTEYRGRFLVFEVEARSGEHVIGRGKVFRAIVRPREHGEKAAARVEQN
jgi:fluoroacetyl-CoA thioesterase